MKLIIDLISAKHSMSKDLYQSKKMYLYLDIRPGVLLESKSVGVFSHIYTLSFSKENTTNLDIHVRILVLMVRKHTTRTLPL
jgi:hypothetical protein